MRGLSADRSPGKQRGGPPRARAGSAGRGRADGVVGVCGKMAAMDLGLRDRVYLITGGSRGLGLATAQALAADGAKVVLSARDAAAVAEAAAGLGGSGQAVGITADNADPDAAARLLAASRERRVGKECRSRGSPCH